MLSYWCVCLFLNSEFLSNNAPREINIDSKTLETVNRNKEEMKGKPESLRFVLKLYGIYPVVSLASLYSTSIYIVNKYLSRIISEWHNEQLESYLYCMWNHLVCWVMFLDNLGTTFFLWLIIIMMKLWPLCMLEDSELWNMIIGT